MTAVLSAATGWILFGGLTLATGAVAAHWLILPGAFAGERGVATAYSRLVAKFGKSGGLLVLVGLLSYFVRQLQEFRDPFVPWQEDADLLLTGTAWGRVWLTAAVGSLVAVWAFALAGRNRPWAWWVATPVMLGLGAFPGLTGHAAAAEEYRTVVLIADSMHVWAAGAWVGGLAVVLLLERSARLSGSGSVLPALVPAFSPVAMAGVGTLIVTGTFASWSHLPSFAALVTTGYGRTLLVKLAAVAVVLALGARNFRLLTPGLGSEEGVEAMRRSAAIELIVAQVVLVATAVLVRTSPMDH